MANRVCIECPAIGPWERGRCPDHERARSRARGTSTQRGYGSAEHRTKFGTLTYDQTRRLYQRLLDRGDRIACWRCGGRIDPARWTLGHCDDDRRVLHGPECPSCQFATSGRTRCPH